MKLTVDTESGQLVVEYSKSLVRGEYVPIELVFVKKGVPYRLGLNVGIGITMKKWTLPGGDLLAADTGITRPDADRTPYTTTLNLNAQNLLDEFTSAVTAVDCSIEVRWEDSAGSGHYIKTNRHKIRVDADTYRDGDEAASVTPVAGIPFVTTSASALLSGEKVLTAGSNITVTVASTTATIALQTSPALTGTPTAPTAAFGTDTTQIATTAFVQDAVDAGVTSYIMTIDALRTALGAIVDDNEVLDLGPAEFIITTDSLSNELGVGITGVKLNLHPGTVLLYATTALAYADRALFDSNMRNFRQFGGVANDDTVATQNALSWRTALASAGADDFTNVDSTYGSTALLLFPKSEGTTSIYYFDEEMHFGARAGLAGEIDTMLRWKAGFAPAAGVAIGTAFTTVSSNVITLANHGLQEGQRVWVSGTLPAELSTSTNYWVKWLSVNTFSLCNNPHIQTATAITLTNGASYSGTVTKKERFGISVLQPTGGGAGNTHEVQCENLYIDCETTNNEGFSALNFTCAQSTTIKRLHVLGAGERVFYQRSGSSALTMEHCWMSRNEYAGIDVTPASLMQLEGVNANALNSVRLINHNTVACDEDGDLWPALSLNNSYHNTFNLVAFEGCRAGVKIYDSSTTNNFAAFDGYCTDAGYEGETEHKLTVTVDTGTNIFTTSSDHGFTAGQRVQLSNSGGALPTHTASTLFVAATDYFVSATSLGATTFRLSLTSGGAALDIDGAGTGTHYVKPPTYLITCRGTGIYDNSWDTARGYSFDYHVRDLSYNAANVQRNYVRVCGNLQTVSEGYTQDRTVFGMRAGTATFAGNTLASYYSTVDEYGTVKCFGASQTLAMNWYSLVATADMSIITTSTLSINPSSGQTLSINADTASFSAGGTLTIPGLVLDGHTAAATGKDLLATATPAEALTVLGLETPTAEDRGMELQVWAANRDDGDTGSGDYSDPYDVSDGAGATSASGLRALLADNTKVPANCCVHLFPGDYYVEDASPLNAIVGLAAGVRLFRWPGATLTWQTPGGAAQVADTADGLNKGISYSNMP